MSLTATISWIGIGSGFVAAALWFWSARITPGYPAAYLDGPPPDIKARMDKQARLNAWAAAFTGVTVLYQAVFMRY